MLQADFAALGRQVPVLHNQISTDADITPILFGAHLLQADDDIRLPPHTIIYNAEHLVLGNWRVPQHYYATLSRFEVWDFSADNVALIRQSLGNPNAHHMPISYCPVFTRVLPGPEDIDVLFYGVMSERRLKVINALKLAGAKVLALAGVFGAERDIEIGRAKLVLNMHLDDEAYFESARCVFLLANRKAVVCEMPTAGLPKELYDGLRVVPYEQLVNACLHLLQDDAEREALATRGFNAVTRAQRDSLSILAQRVAAAPADTSDTRKTLPRVLVAGAGHRMGRDYVNADINPRRSTDWHVDFGAPLDFCADVDFGRHGLAPLRPGMFDAILAHHILEHIPDLVTAVTNFLVLLRDGGCLHIEVPYDLSHGAWQDPTHVRAFNERSWWYFTDNHAYLDWTSARFDLINLTFLLSPLGRQMRAQAHDDGVILRTPRAVDSMRLILAKRPLVAENPAREAAS